MGMLPNRRGIWGLGLGRPASMVRSSSREYKQMPEGRWYILALGIQKPSKPIPLAPGVTLRPLTRTRPVAAFFPGFAVNWSGDDVKRPMVALAGAGCDCELEVNRDPQASQSPEVNHAWLVSTLLVLRGFKNYHGIRCRARSWDDDPIDDVNDGRSDLDYSTWALEIGVPLVDLSSDDAAWITSRFSRIQALPKGGFANAIAKAYDCRYEPRLDDAIRTIWSAIDTLFSKVSDDSDRREIRLVKAIPRLLSNAITFERTKFLRDRVRDPVVHNLSNPDCSEEKLVEPLNESWWILQQLLLLHLDKPEEFTRARLRELSKD